MSCEGTSSSSGGGVDMGRVRRYKKVKSFDPFAKKGSDSSSSSSSSKKKAAFDEPPEVFENRSRKQQAEQLSWDNEEDKEVMMQREALRALRTDKQNDNAAIDKRDTSKRADETMKQFKQRIRDETKVILRDELKGMTATAKKRKLRLKERKLKRRGKNTIKSSSSSDGDDYDDNGVIQEVLEFRAGEAVRFGDVADRPPELTFRPKKAVMRKSVGGEDDGREGTASTAAKKRRLEDIWSTGGDVPKRSVSSTGALSGDELRQAQAQAAAAYKVLKMNREAGRL